MKIVKLGTTEKLEITKGSHKGVKVQLSTVAAVVNTALPATAISLSNINAKATLVRGGKPTELFNDTLDILIEYFHAKRGYYNAKTGIKHVAEAPGVYAENMRYIFLDFQGVINVNEGDDQLTIELTAGKAAEVYTADASSANSSIQFDVLEGVGYETHVSQLVTDLVRADEKSESITIGDNCAKLMLLNFDKTSYANPVVKDLHFNSDRVSYHRNFLELVQAHLYDFDTNIYEGQAKGLFPNPQNFILFDGVIENGLAFIHNVSIKVNFNYANVAQGKNIIAYTIFTQDERQLRKARELYSRHIEKNNQIALTARK